MVQINSLRIGGIYWVAGKGPMKLRELPHPPQKTTITMTQPPWYNFYVSAEDLVGEMFLPDMEKYLAELNRAFEGKPDPDVLRTLREWRAELDPQSMSVTYWPGDPAPELPPGSRVVRREEVSRTYKGRKQVGMCCVISFPNQGD